MKKIISLIKVYMLVALVALSATSCLDKDPQSAIPENDAMEPIVIRGADRARLVIQGEAIMVMKDL